MIGNEPVKSIFGGIFMIENKYYERKIKYLDLLENGERVGGAGFIKTEVKGMEISLAVTVKGLHPTDTYEREVMLQAGDGEFSVGRIALKEGQGQFKYHTVMDYSQLQGIRIALGGSREICCRWREEKRSSVSGSSAVGNGAKQSGTAHDGNAGEAEEMEKVKPERRKQEKPREIQLIPWDEIRAVEESLERTERIMSKPPERETEVKAATEIEISAKEIAEEGTVERETAGENPKSGKTAAEKMTVKGTTEKKVTERTTAVSGKSKRIPENAIRTGGRNLSTENAAAGKGTERWTERSAQRPASGSASGHEKRPVRLMEDKWQQIWAIYPHIRPFQDEREYLSISPADFVLLPDEAYRAANNSFLLHGYYNYDHLILTKIEKRGEISYYIGVPGNYYEREKQVAIMFGFESFECGTEPAQAGDFGYYMMRTQL